MVGREGKTSTCISGTDGECVGGGWGVKVGEGPLDAQLTTHRLHKEGLILCVSFLQGIEHLSTSLALSINVSGLLRRLG